MNEKIKNRIKRARQALTTSAIFVTGIVAGDKINIETTPSKESGINIEVFHKTNSQYIVDQDKLNKALFKAIRKSDLETVKNLIEQGANINARDSKGRTPIMISVNKSVHERLNFQKAKDQYNISMHLISKNANLLIKDKDGASVYEYMEYDKYDGSMMNHTQRILHEQNSNELRTTIAHTIQTQVQQAQFVANARSTFYY